MIAFLSRSVVGVPGIRKWEWIELLWHEVNFAKTWIGDGEQKKTNIGMVSSFGIEYYVDLPGVMCHLFVW